MRLSRWMLIAPLALAACMGAAPRESRDPWQQPDRVVAEMGLKPGHRVADVGCGSGYFTFRLAKAVGETGEVLAEDIEAKALKAVGDRAQKENARNVKTVQGEPTDAKLPADSLDAVVVCDVLHHVPADLRLPLIKNVVRAMKAGAMLYVIDWRVDAEISHDRDRRIPAEQLIGLGKDAGLTLDAEYHYLKHQVFYRFRKPGG
ncbi:MAG: methyltransferase domain-containing protein [Planctomycetes bacterium]|nr:methyltransferase domain-containing protein [Planctomycetota bacterium]